MDPVAQYEEWTVEPAERSWLSRFIAPQANARPTTVGFVFGALGLAAFVASLALDWVKVDVNLRGGDVTSLALSASGVRLDQLGQVYAIGVVAVFGLLGAVLPRPELALRFRLAAAGVCLALAGVILSTVLRLPDLATEQYSPVLGGDAKVSYEPGIICAFLAVVLPLAAIWVAARPAVRFALAEAEAAGERAAPPVQRAPGRPVGQRGLTVSAEPIDLTVRPDR
jgi:hypothetical protein